MTRPWLFARVRTMAQRKRSSTTTAGKTARGATAPRPGAPRKRAREYVVRLGLSLEPSLLGALDRWVKARNSLSRSDAIRFLVRKELADAETADPQADAVGTVMLLYRHTAPSVLRRLTAAQHRWGQHVQFSTHVHLKGDACVEVVVLAGKRGEVREAAEDLRGVKGILQGDYLIGAPGAIGAGTGHHHPHRSMGGAHP
jgi:CopG family transcriptional regulator, nickel-responsive regulator